MGMEGRKQGRKKEEVFFFVKKHANISPCENLTRQNKRVKLIFLWNKLNNLFSFCII